MFFPVNSDYFSIDEHTGKISVVKIVMPLAGVAVKLRAMVRCCPLFKCPRAYFGCIIHCTQSAIDIIGKANKQKTNHWVIEHVMTWQL